MIIERRTLRMLKKYILKKHTPVLDFETGSVWVPSRPQDGFDFVARFAAPDLRCNLPWYMLAVCPDILQSEVVFEEFDGGRFLSGANGAHFRISKTRLCCVGEEESNRAWTLTMRAKEGGLMPNLETLTEGRFRAAEAIAARFKKACDIPESAWQHSWYRQNGRLRYDLWKRGGNPGYVSLKIWL